MRPECVILSSEKVAVIVSGLTMEERMQLERAADAVYYKGGGVLPHPFRSKAEGLGLLHPSTGRPRTLVCKFFCGDSFILVKKRR